MRVPTNGLRLPLVGELYRVGPAVRLPRSSPADCSGGPALVEGVVGGGRHAFYSGIRSENVMCRLVTHFLGSTGPGIRIGSGHVRGILSRVQGGVCGAMSVSSLTTVSYLSGSRFVHLFGGRINAAPLRCVGRGGVRGTRLVLVARSVPMGGVTCLLTCRSRSCFGHLFGGVASIAPRRCERLCGGWPSCCFCTGICMLFSASSAVCLGIVPLFLVPRVGLGVGETVGCGRVKGANVQISGLDFNTSSLKKIFRSVHRTRNVGTICATMRGKVGFVSMSPCCKRCGTRAMLNGTLGRVPHSGCCLSAGIKHCKGSKIGA